MFDRILKIVLIAISAYLALLIVILVMFPYRLKPREKARQSSCTNNLKQLGIALSMYADDWDDSLPNSTRDRRKDGAAINASAWDEQIAKYVKSDGVFKCPSNPLKRYSVHQPPQRVNGKKQKTRVVSYGMNDQLLGVPPGGRPPSDRKVSQARSVQYGDIGNPGELILLSEMSGWDPAHRNKSGTGMAAAAELHPYYHVTGPGMNEGTWDSGWGVARDVHSGGCNFLYVDNHVKWKKIVNTLGRQAANAFIKVGGGYPGNEWMLRRASG
jgi:prepilin-type processing-associated H-X9-DG protein